MKPAKNELEWQKLLLETYETLVNELNTDFKKNQKVSSLISMRENKIIKESDPETVEERA